MAVVDLGAALRCTVLLLLCHGCRAAYTLITSSPQATAVAPEVCFVGNNMLRPNGKGVDVFDVTDIRLLVAPGATVSFASAVDKDLNLINSWGSRVVVASDTIADPREIIILTDTTETTRIALPGSQAASSVTLVESGGQSVMLVETESSMRRWVLPATLCNTANCLPADTPIDGLASTFSGGIQRDGGTGKVVTILGNKGVAYTSLEGTPVKTDLNFGAQTVCAMNSRIYGAVFGDLKEYDTGGADLGNTQTAGMGYAGSIRCCTATNEIATWGTTGLKIYKVDPGVSYTEQLSVDVVVGDVEFWQGHIIVSTAAGVDVYGIDTSAPPTPAPPTPASPTSAPPTAVPATSAPPTPVPPTDLPRTPAAPDMPAPVNISAVPLAPASARRLAVATAVATVGFAGSVGSTSTGAMVSIYSAVDLSRRCEEGVPEVSPVVNPLTQRVGPGAYAAHLGAVVFVAVACGSLCLLVTGVYAALRRYFWHVTGRHPTRIENMRLLGRSRIGWLAVPFAFLYASILPSAFMIALHSTYKWAGMLLLVVLAVLWLFVVAVVTVASQRCCCRPVEGTHTLWFRMFSGTQEWMARTDQGKEADNEAWMGVWFAVFDAYTWESRYFLLWELVAAVLLGALQAIEAKGQTACVARAAGIGAVVVISRPFLTLFENVTNAVMLTLEVVVVVLSIVHYFVDDDALTDAADAISKFVTWGLLVQFVVCTSMFVRDRYKDWRRRGIQACCALRHTGCASSVCWTASSHA
eukprot:TRINITY_DN3417_c0_g1_i10.p1 TRINITY_DN3417_c0_g1~~TRINITY_DN3417_c0_g1_i10.p1  ORF type:complete len:752 (+),score=150.76 TRINITY_DN3417_c0_g1_i10:77-2332(+)